MWELLRLTPMRMGTGDDQPMATPAVYSTGSPPRIWGRRNNTCDCERPCRLTPTCVGTTKMTISSYIKMEAHPHVCGDDRR